MAGENEKLITPNEAIGRIIHDVGSEVEAKKVLADGLRSNKLRLNVKVFWTTDFGHLDGPWEPIKWKGFAYGENCDLQPGAFRASVCWPDDTNYWRWETGEFVILASELSEARPYRCYMKGARFFEHEVLKLIGRSARSGGPKADRERWALFWINILRDFTGDTFDWTQFENPHQLKVAFLAANAGDNPFSENNIDSVVALAWKRLVKRSLAEIVAANLGPVSDQYLVNRP